MENIEVEKIRKRADIRRARELKSGYIILILVIVIALSVILGFFQYKSNGENKKLLAQVYMEGINKASEQTSNTYQMYDVVRLYKEPKDTALMFANIYNESQLAHDTISSMHYTSSTLVSALDYLSLSKETSYRLMEKSIKGEKLSNEDIKEIETLRKYGKSLSDELSYTLSDINVLDRKITDTLIAKTDLFDKNGINKTSLLTSANSLFTEPETPPVTFSESYKSRKISSEYKFLEDAKEITAEEGKDSVKKFLGNYDIISIEFVHETDLAAEFALPLYSYDITLKGDLSPQISMDITQKGGYPVWMLNYSLIEQSGNFISVEKAGEFCNKFLTSNNFSNMVAIKNENSGNYASFFFVPFVDDVYYYNDLIILKVSLINGEILGFESKNYLNNHHEREKKEGKLTPEQAKELISEQIKVNEVRKAFIFSKANGEEIFCYEFKGEFDKKAYSVFINGDNGKQENVEY